MNKNQLSEEILKEVVKNIPKDGLHQFKSGKTPIIIGESKDMIKYKEEIFYIDFSLEETNYAYVIGKRLEK